METKKILIVSLGSIGKRHLKNARLLIPNAEIAVLRLHNQIDQRVPEGADRLFFKLEDAMSFSPHALIIASPANSHLANTLPFLELNTNVFIEKPLAANTKGFEDFLKIIATARNFVMVGYILRFLPALTAIKRCIDTGLLGNIHTAHIQVGQYLPDWRPHDDYRKGVSGQAALGGGALLELSHELDYATWLFGYPDALYCRHNQSSTLEIDVEDNAHLIFEYGPKANHRTVVIQLDFLQQVAQMKFQIVGSKATLISDLITEEVVILDKNHPRGYPLEFTPSKNGNEPYIKQFDFFFSKCFKDYIPQFDQTLHFEEYADVNQAARLIALIEKAKLSNLEGRRICL